MKKISLAKLLVQDSEPNMLTQSQINKIKKLMDQFQKKIKEALDIGMDMHMISKKDKRLPILRDSILFAIRDAMREEWQHYKYNFEDYVKDQKRYKYINRY